MPFPNEHACRLREPGEFQDDSFRRITRETSEGKSFDVIRADRQDTGETQDQSHRYPTSRWSEDEARQHCQEHDGIKFEPASGDEDEEASEIIKINQNQVASPRYFQSLADQVWAVQSPAVLHELSQIVQRAGSMEAVQKVQAQRVERTFNVQERDGVAIVPIMGPIMPRANLFSMISGATSLDMLALDLNKLAGDPNIKSILLNIDSPGGTVTDVDETAGMIAEVASRKRVVAYVGGTAASAAYWLASAANEIVTARTGQLGSIGVVATIAKQKEPDESGNMNFEIVSSGAENKRPDPETDSGRSLILERVDEIERLFVDSVASNRGVDRDTVLKDFGRGNVFVGGSAVRRNLADRTGTFEGVLRELGAEQSSPEQTTAKETEETTMADDPNPAEPQAANAADVVDYCTNAGVPQLAAGLIREQASMETVKQRVSSVGEMQSMSENMVSQNMIDKATADKLLDDALKLGKSPDALSRDLLSASFHRQSPDDAVVTRSTPETGATSDNSEKFLSAAFEPYINSTRN